MIQEQSGFDPEDLAEMMWGEADGYVLRFIINVRMMLTEICTEGNRLRNSKLYL